MARKFPVSCRLPTVMLLGMMVSESSGSGAVVAVIVTAAVAETTLPSGLVQMALIVLEPALTPVTSPEAETVATVAILEVELASAAELKQEQAEPPPDKETLVVDNEGEKARIGHLIQPGVELGEKVPDGFHHGFAEVHNRPRRRRRSWTWLRTRSRVSSEISWINRLSCRYSSTHERTSSMKSTGT